jgi:hypothetical protein
VGLLPGLPSITSGGGAIPITGGAATSGDIGPTDIGFGTVNIGGVFGSEAGGNKFALPLIIIAGVILGAMFLQRRR